VGGRLLVPLALLLVFIMVTALGMFAPTLRAQEDPWIPVNPSPTGFIEERRIVMSEVQLEDFRFRLRSIDPPEGALLVNVKNLSDRSRIIEVSAAVFDKDRRLLCAGGGDYDTRQILGSREVSTFKISLGTCGVYHYLSVRFFQVAAYGREWRL